ncbi:WD repeat-containing protein-like [Pyrus ussuriensis x Pyrus communis]|uniref:WD repeat-containing protein-like n=1 Tax=Pyrus ussuriensis x Pyrus communis TaxID=2448454 RepID=A0A5N5H619_9ROSA|nr:WD repeat-containing protein-like [Pyrus ussuriensis x Pyrus communis]
MREAPVKLPHNDNDARKSMSYQQGYQFDYMADEGDMSDFVEDVEEENQGGDMGLDEYDMLTKVSDTSSAQARRGKDIQGIPWDRLNITREKYRLTRLEQYRNYENIPLSGEAVDKTIAKVVGHLDYSFASAWHPDGRIFATGNQDKTSRVWDIRNLSLPVAVLKNNFSAARSICFSSDGQFMVVAEPAYFVHIYSTKADYKVRQEIDFFGEISGASMSPDDESLYIGIWDRTYASLLQYNRRHTYGYLDSYF